jgi:hypothetical protein
VFQTCKLAIEAEERNSCGTKHALQNAASIASLILTTETLEVEKPEKKSAASAGGGGGHIKRNNRKDQTAEKHLHTY